MITTIAYKQPVEFDVTVTDQFDNELEFNADMINGNSELRIIAQTPDPKFNADQMIVDMCGLVRDTRDLHEVIDSLPPKVAKEWAQAILDRHM